MFCKICALLIFVIEASFISTIDDIAKKIVDSKENNEVNNSAENYGENVTVDFLNFGHNSSEFYQRNRLQYFENPERVLQSKVNVLARLLKIHVDNLRDKSDQVELVFLVDSSASVGIENFRSELNFVRKLLSDFTVEINATRVAIVTFAGRRHIRRHIDQISRNNEDDQKCLLMNKQLNDITYTGGGTYTRGALLEALAILQNSRENSEKVVFLITDGFSNSGDPRPAAQHLKNIGATIFTFGIRTGNIEELHDIASDPGYTHSYLLDSFSQFEALARRALHRDLKAGRYVPVKISSDCNWLCSSKNESEENWECCDEIATCACGTATGHYACLCPRGYFGSGLKGFCQPCPNGTFDPGDTPLDSGGSCVSCLNVNHVTMKIPATSLDDCVCAPGFITDGENCEAIRCPKLQVPDNGYFVKASACSNVVNAACGLRCRIGFNLIGDSIRLCRNDGIWSGTEPQCLLKTCAALRAPLHGRIRCEHDEDERKIKSMDLAAHPIDTRCQFRCDNGFQLRGSKVRNCLPLSRWDGLKVTCKQIKCEPLRKLANGNINPEICTGTKKLPFATNCTITCDNGFVLVGPKIRHCSGKNGVWSQRHTVNQCIDKTAPVLICPMNSTWETLPGKDYAIVNWIVPIASDNSDNIVNVWSKPHVLLPWKAKIGLHRIVYIAQDSSGNKAKCKFVVQIVDKEPPIVENCVDPPIFLTTRKTGVENVTWIEPIFHDNSGHSMEIKKSHSSPECNCTLGKTKIFYNATDAFDNTAHCVINITVKDACKDTPVLSNSQMNCQKFEDKGVQCVVTCEEGYKFIIDQPDLLDHDDSMTLTCGLDDIAWNSTSFPDCSVTEIPNTIGHDVSVILQGNTSVCDNSTVINQLTDQISGDLESNMLEICGNDIDCSIVKTVQNCTVENTEENEVDTNFLGRRKRSLSFIEDRDKGKKNMSGKREKPKNKSRVKRKKGKIEMKLRFIGKIVAENRNNPKLGIQKLREKIEAMTKSGRLSILNNKTNQEIEKWALNLNTIFEDPREICEIGRVLKKHNCTKCPAGTFHNSTRERCQACPLGEYQNLTATSKCIKCPLHTFTKKMHSKNFSDCITMCKPGQYSSRKPHQVSSVSLRPCATCEIGYYQSDYGKIFCHKCPNNKTTNGRGTTSLDDCFSLMKIEDPCTKMPCLNGGLCISDNGSFSCDCQENFMGSMCEKRQNPCESSPCLNEGQCNPLKITEWKSPYTCDCKSGYTGNNCQIYIDECSLNPCQNGGSCISTEKDFNCVCRDGFEGDYCDTIVNHCEPWTCDEDSTCITVDGTWKCLCKAGYLGLRCNLLPCDWIPCNPNSICLNVEEINATRNSYRCVCPDGYEGKDCSTRIDHCKYTVCLNGGKCNNGLVNYTCQCPITFVGLNCEIELSADYVLHFSEIGTSDYVILEGPKKNITALTVCLWLQSVDTFNYGTVFSYATKNQDNTLTLTDYNGFVLYVNGEKVVTDITVNDGYWHFLCVDWKSEDGSWNAYVDGVLRDNGTQLAKKSMIPANGTIVIGQEQDRLGGGFSAAEAFLGKLSYLDLWDDILGHEAVKKMKENCDNYHGSIFAWAQMRQHLRGNVGILDGIFCRGCPTLTPPSKGYINASEDGSEIGYSCEIGHSVRVGKWIGSTYRRKCLKHGDWEGHRTPICTKVKCGYPGYFPRGRVEGRSFLYGDEIHYNCDEGYELRGNPHRVCNADGKWSGLQPICIGVTCKNLLAPENGDIEYIIEEHERDDVSILQVGQQLEFKCDNGFALSGERYLTCLQSGKWDYERPICIPSGCPVPELKQNAYVTTKQSAVLPIYDKINKTSISLIFDESPKENGTSIYSFGDVVGISCLEGYKFHGNRNLLVEFRLQCSTNGTWSGILPDCVRLECSPPNQVENGRIFFLLENGTEIEISSEQKINGTKIIKIRDSDKSEIDESNDTESDIDLFDKLASEADRLENAENLMKIEFFTGTKILILCDRGFGKKEKTLRICQESEIWSSEEPECKRRHCPIEDDPAIDFLAKKIGNSESKNFLEKIANNFFNIRGFYGKASILFEGDNYEDKVIVACENETFVDFEAIGAKDIRTLTWECDDEGKWKIHDLEIDESHLARIINEGIEICRGITCDPPQIPHNGYIVNASNTTEEIIKRKIAEIVFFRCGNGYEIEGSDEATCLVTGNWSKIPACSPISCKNPPKILNAILENASSANDKYVFGDSITYKCTEGYRIFGQASARCLANGKWSRIHGKCSKISCGKPKIPPGVTIYGRSYLYQEKLSYNCPNGGTKGSIICKSNGKWSDPPICKS